MNIFDPQKIIRAKKHFWLIDDHLWLKNHPSYFMRQPNPVRGLFVSISSPSRSAPYITKDSIKIYGSLMNIFDKKQFVLWYSTACNT